jgi:mannose/cellobiose epimerase-like protein (N-acyl-D-glucosamine 2-epimerase family)
MHDDPRMTAGMILRLFLLTLGMMTTVPCSAETMDELKPRYAPRLEKNLKENIIPFWYPKSLDTKNGGYLISFGPKGELKPGAAKMIVTQARMVWLSARLARAGHGREYLDAAGHGYRFLTGKMWDEKHGGFYWEVDETGTTVTAPKKHLYGQAFALYALSEYALASKKPEVKEFAERLFRLLETGPSPRRRRRPTWARRPA